MLDIFLPKELKKKENENKEHILWVQTLGRKELGYFEFNGDTDYGEIVINLCMEVENTFEIS